MYQPYSHNSNVNGYQQPYPQQYQAENQDYGPAPQQAQGPSVPYQQPSNPFLAPVAPHAPFVAQPKKGKKKKTQNSATVVMTTPPVAAVAPTQATNAEVNPPPSTMPGHEWVLVAKGAATAATSTSPDIIVVEPEPVKVNAGLQQAQADLDKLQAIVESSLVCLLEPRREYPLSKFGILDVPAHPIEVLTGTTTLASILLSGLYFLGIYGLPDQKENRLLGKAKHFRWKAEGVAAGFCNISHLDPAEQNSKLEMDPGDTRSKTP